MTGDAEYEKRPGIVIPGRFCVIYGKLRKKVRWRT